MADAHGGGDYGRNDSVISTVKVAADVLFFHEINVTLKYDNHSHCITFAWISGAIAYFEWLGDNKSCKPRICFYCNKLCWSVRNNSSLHCGLFHVGWTYCSVWVISSSFVGFRFYKWHSYGCRLHPFQQHGFHRHIAVWKIRNYGKHYRDVLTSVNKKVSLPSARTPDKQLGRPRLDKQTATTIRSSHK